MASGATHVIKSVTDYLPNSIMNRYFLHKVFCVLTEEGVKRI